jgi:hypothetical protein
MGRGASRAVSIGKVGVSARVELDELDLQGGGRFNLMRFGLDKQADANFTHPQAVDDRLQPPTQSGRIKAALRGYFLAAFRDDTDFVWMQFERNLKHLVGGRHFLVDMDADCLADTKKILVPDMAAVLAQVDGNRVRAGALSGERGLDRIGIRDETRLPQRRNMVNIDTELEHQEKK